MKELGALMKGVTWAFPIPMLPHAFFGTAPLCCVPSCVYPRLRRMPSFLGGHLLSSVAHLRDVHLGFRFSPLVGRASIILHLSDRCLWSYPRSPQKHPRHQGSSCVDAAETASARPFCHKRAKLWLLNFHILASAEC